MAKANPFRFSTKYQDEETDLLYYGYRYYSANTGKWNSRDPIEEAGGPSLYAFASNDHLNAVDVAGQMAHKTVSLKAYWDDWKKCHPGLSQSQYEDIKKTLSRGCVGITCINLGERGMPDMGNCYGTLAQAQKRQKEMEKNCECKDKRNWKGGTSKPQVYSTRFHSEGNSYAPDPDTGKVDMSVWKFRPKPGYVNFDYGFQCGKNQWAHANHCEPGMEVYQSDLEYYSRPLLDFDKQVFCVACEDWRFGPCAKSNKSRPTRDGAGFGAN